MATKIGNGLDLQNTQIYNAVLQVLSSFGMGFEGKIAYDSTVKSPGFYDGGAWRYLDPGRVPNGSIPIGKLSTDPLARANHTGTQLAATISNFDTAVRTSRLDQIAAPTVSVAFNGQRITNLGVPTADNDAVTKKYVDDAVQQAAAGLDPKDAVQAATTDNITLSGTQTIDGVSVSVGMRVLVKNQTNAVQNGIYVVTSSAWARAADAGQGLLTNGALVLCTAGTTNQATQWFLNTPDPITVGTTVLSWVQFGAGASYSAGDGLSLTGGTFTVKPKPSGGLAVNSSGVYLDATVPRKYAATIGDGSSTSFNVDHNLGTRDVTVAIYEAASPYSVWITDAEPTTANRVVVSFATAPAANFFRVVVTG